MGGPCIRDSNTSSSSSNRVYEDRVFEKDPIEETAKISDLQNKKKIRIALVSCGKRKKSFPCKAKDMYDSPLFKNSLTLAYNNTDIVFILSAKHHLLPLEKVINPYNQTLKDMGKNERIAWARVVFSQIEEFIILNELSWVDIEFVFLAGKAYSEYLKQLFLSKGSKCIDPMQGLSQGKRLQYLKNHSII